MLNCSNQLDGSAFGFTLTVPDGFACVPTSSAQSLLVLTRVTYSQESTGVSVSIAVTEPQSNDPGMPLTGVTAEQQPNQTNPAGIEFQVQKLTLDLQPFGMRTSYSGGATLPSGNNLAITVSAQNDMQALPDTLNQIIETVVFTNG